MLLHTFVCVCVWGRRGYKHQTKVCTESWLGEKISCRIRESDWHQQHSRVMLSQVSCNPALCMETVSLWAWRRLSCAVLLCVRWWRRTHTRMCWALRMPGHWQRLRCNGNCAIPSLSSPSWGIPHPARERWTTWVLRRHPCSVSTQPQNPVYPPARETWIQTHQRFKRTLIYYDIDNTMQIFREIASFRPQNDT